MCEPKKFSTLLRAGGIIFVTAVLSSGPAAAHGDGAFPAAGKHNGHSAGYYFGGRHKTAGIFKHRHRRGAIHRHFGGKGFGAGRYTKYPYNGRVGSFLYGGVVNRACHPTSKTGYDAYGRRARIGGTMCYDRFGQSYVVEGSRYIISYY